MLRTDDGVGLYFEKLGEGKQLVLVPNGIYLREDFARFANGDRALVFYDVRNRGRSDAVTDPAKLVRGVHQDADDIDAVRRHFGAAKVDLIGHSYVGMTVALYAMKYPEHVGRVLQLGAIQADAKKKYAPPLSFADEVLRDAYAKMGAMEKERASMSPEAFCRKFWDVLRPIYVADPAFADRVRWERCELPLETAFMAYFMRYLVPSMQNTTLTAEDYARAVAPVLAIHGKKDRSAAYGGGREWALLLPNARLLTIENAAHAPWIEAPDVVYPAIETFLAGAWPAGIEKVETL